MNCITKKAFHVINRNGQFQGRLAFHPAVHTKFNKDTQFHSIWETSNFFDMFLPEGVSYGELTGYAADSQSAESVIEWMEDKGRTGFKNVQCGDGKAHRAIFGDWDGDRGQAIVVPVDSKIKSLTDLGLSLTMKSKADVPKVRKYFRRIRAHHEWAIAGEVSGIFETKLGDGMNFIMNGVESSVLQVDLKTLKGDNLALADGAHLVHIDFLKAIGLDQYEVGDAFKGTFLNAYGLGKGFFHVVDHIDFGVIIYGPKSQVQFDKVFFGSLGDVKGGDAYTDLQAMINFDVCDEGFAFGLAQTFLREVDDAMHNEDKLRALLMHNLPEPTEILDDEANRAENWVLLEALRLGVPILKNPGLFRRAVRFFMTKVLDTTKGRIPYGPIARRFNLMPDINVFGADGSVDVNRSSIPDGKVVCMDSGAGDFFMYRQPSGHKLEGVRAVCVHNRRFQKFLGRDRVIVGHGAAKYLGTMGGGDMDDAVIGTSHHQLVEIMATGDYPVTELPAADAAVLESNPYSKGRKYPAVWDMTDYFDAMTKAREISLSIGPIVNSVMLDTLLSGRHKENMLSYLADSIADSKDEFAKDGYRAAYDWLRNREDHQLKTVASNLESFIDYIKMAKGDPMVLEPLVALVAKVRDESLVLPQCWTIGGSRGTGRITIKRLEAQDYVLAPSIVCITLQKIAVEVSHLEAAAREEEWFMVDKMPEALDLAFPVTGRFMDGSHEDPYMAIAMELRSFWAEEWTTVLGRQNVTEQESELERERITKHLKTVLGEYSDAPEIQQAIVVAIARLTYRRRHTEPRLNQDGTVRSFPDGLLWNNYVGNIYIAAMKEAGLTGLYVAVHFDRWSAALKQTVTGVEVLDGGLIRRPEDNFLVGYVNSSEHVKPGMYTMNYGLITVSEPSEELRMSSNVVDELAQAIEEEVAFN